MKHLLRFIGIILSVIISISFISLLPASAQANTFNLHIFMCGTELCNSMGYHHSDTKAFLNMLPSTIDLDNEKPMVITASSMCKDSSTSSSCYPVYGINENWTGRMVVADASYVHYYDTNPYAHFRSIMVHEIGHNYGTPDHYNDTVDPCPNCIWGTNRNTYAVYSNCMTCADCSSTIYNNRGLYNHTP